jgi:hypothetical protein
MAAWDASAELVRSLEPTISAVAVAFEGRSHVPGEEIEKMVEELPLPRSPPSERVQRILKTAFLEKWKLGSRRTEMA